MKLPFTRSVRAKNAVVCDVGSGGAAVSIVESNPESAQARVLMFERGSLPLTESARSDEQAITQIQTLLTELLTKLLDRNAKAGNVPPEDIVCVVHPPWVKTASTKSTRTFTASTEMTSALIGEIAQEAAQLATDLSADDIFERAVTRILLNGYPTRVPEGKATTRADVTALQSTMTRSMKNALDHALGAALPGHAPLYVSSLYALGLVIADCAPTLAHYTLIDVASSATAGAAFREGASQTYALSDMGWRSLVEELGTALGSVDDALSAIRMVAEDTCSDARCTDVLAKLQKIEPRFVESYGKMLAALSKDARVPGDMLIVAPPEIGAWFVNLFGRIDFAPFTLSGRPFVPEQLFAHYLARIVAFPDGQADTGIAAASAFVHMRARTSVL